MDVARAAFSEEGDDRTESSKKEAKRPTKRQEVVPEDRQQVEESNLVQTGLAVLENFSGGAEFATPRTRHHPVDPVHVERSRSQGNSPPQVQTEGGCRPKTNAGRSADGPWQSAFRDSPPKKRSCAELGEVAGGSPPLPREIQALAQRLRQGQRPKLKAFNGEGSLAAAMSGAGCGRARDAGRFIPGAGKASRSLPSLQRSGTSRLIPHGNPWPIATGRSPRSPGSLQRPASTPCSSSTSWL